MERIEEKIRKYLAKNLSMVSGDLELIQEEYPLRNIHGSSGFIDILAKDSENNYVIIELKRSNQAARQTLNEVCKYCALIKQNLNIRDSEIRVVIVSSEWTELLVPYSEFYKYVNLYVEGYKVNLDEKNVPISCKRIDPIKIDYQRKFSTEHLAFLYTTQTNIDCAINKIQEILPKLSLKDYVILKMSITDKIPYPFCIYVVFQRYSEYYYLNALKKIKEDLKEEYAIYDEVLEYKDGYKDDEEGYLRCLEENISCYITNEIESDDLEIGYPEKFQSIIHQSNWQVDKVVKGGNFKDDVRLSKDIIIKEVMGVDGSNQILYINQTHSKHKPKLEEIANNAVNCLKFNEVWHHHISSMLDIIGSENTDYRIVLNIFNPDSILESIAGVAHHKAFSYIPGYDFLIDYTTENKFINYYGKITWNGIKRDLDELLKIFFRNNPFDYFLRRQFGNIAEIDSAIMEYLGLEYATNILRVTGGKAQINDVIFKNDKIEVVESKVEKTIIEFVNENDKFVKDLVQFFERNCVGIL